MLSGSKVLVTGHTGFKGSWLVGLLQASGVEVVGVSNFVRSSSLYAKIGEEFEVEEHFCDIRNAKELNRIVKQVNADGIFHLAAQPLVLESYEVPLETFETNIMGTANVILSAYQAPKTKFIVVVTTDKVYKNDNLGRSFSEEDHLGGHDPYSASKAAAEIITNSLRNFPNREINFPIVTARAGNVIGGGDDSENRLLPDIVRSILAHESVLVRNPDSTRPWQHVLDPLSGYLRIADQLLKGEAIANSYNFGPKTESELSVLEVCKIAISCWEHPSGFRVIGGDRSSQVEAKFLALDSSRARKDLGWSSKLTPSEAILWTMEWEKRFHQTSSSAFELTREQIFNYSALKN